MPDDRPKLAHIEFLRGFAALIVVAVHSRLIFWVGLKQYWADHGLNWSLDAALAYLSVPIAWGSFGVPLFFVISGYVIHRQPAQWLTSGQIERFSVLGFWRRRFFKIYPTLLAAMVITVLLDNLSNTMIPPGHRLRGASENHDWDTFVGNLLTMQGISVSTLGTNGALWTLALEIQFYALYPLLLWLRHHVGWQVCAVGIALLNTASYFAFEQQGVTLFASYYLSWCLGAYLAERSARQEPHPNRLITAGATVLAFGAGCAVLGRSSFFAFQLWSIAAAGLILLTSQRRFDGNGLARGVRRVGDFSYSLYVVHVPVLTVFAVWLYGYETQDSIVPAALMVLACLPFGMLLHALVERPATRLGNQPLFGKVAQAA